MANSKSDETRTAHLVAVATNLTGFSRREIDALDKYTAETAADCGCSYLDALAQMDDEPSVAAEDLGITVAEVRAWCRATHCTEEESIER